MNVRSNLLTASNAALYFTKCAVVGTGLLVELQLDDENGARRLPGTGTQKWGEFHFPVALDFVGLTVLHLLPSWSWLRSTVRYPKWARLVMGASVAVVTDVPFWTFGHQERVPEKRHPDHW